MNKYVLIADDDEDARFILGEAVESMGLAVKMAADGQAALTIARQDPPLLVLLDVMMPGFNGLQVLSRLRSKRDTRDLPVLIISASGVGSVDPARLPGNTRVMQKASYDLAQLRTMIASMIGLDNGTG